VVAQALLAELGEPLVSTNLVLPGQDEPVTQGRQIAAQLGHAVDARHRETICWIWSRHELCTCCRAESRVIASPKVLSKFR
jgi:hypothetical protein